LDNKVFDIIDARCNHEKTRKTLQNMSICDYVRSLAYRISR